MVLRVILMVGVVDFFAEGFVVDAAAGFEVDLRGASFLFLEDWELAQVLNSIKTLRISIYNKFAI
jgi:hypothetical protein